ncbi:MAG TPA: nitroreductase/quinone reductase family protein [Ilumatobacteraceae bacterium]|nr:nitroreductase/quinone reductase family protein [Ilumatobacteraceae bacterium]
MRDWASFNADVIAEFRANRGVVARFGGLPVVIVHTIGAQSGKVREIPLIPVFEDDRMLLFGTAQGAPTDPAWCFNLRVNPVVDVEVATETYRAEVIELSADEASVIVQRRAEATPQLAEYVASAAPRTIPVFEINRY